MKGILDTVSIPYYKEEFMKSIDKGISADDPQLNKILLKSRLEILNSQEEALAAQISKKKKEVEIFLAEIGGELLTLNQILSYIWKEQGACEAKIKELSDEIAFIKRD